ncbi:MAG: SocA family protein [Bacteroidales bacterium]|nr:SocA family protein [Bacteroidales bacterium]
MNTHELANLIVYLAIKVDNLYITKLLKLLYLIDETSVKKTGFPLTWLDYKVYKYGAVCTDVYQELTFNRGEKFKEYFEVIQERNGQLIKHIRDFDKNEFSEYDFEICNEIINLYAHLTSNELVELLHKPDTLWSKAVKKHNIVFNEFNDSNHTINFLNLISNKPQLKNNYETVKASIDFRKELTSNV